MNLGRAAASGLHYAADIVFHCIGLWFAMWVSHVGVLLGSVIYFRHSSKMPDAVNHAGVFSSKERQPQGREKSTAEGDGCRKGEKAERKRKREILP